MPVVPANGMVRVAHNNNNAGNASVGANNGVGGEEERGTAPRYTRPTPVRCGRDNNVGVNRQASRR